MQKMDAVLDEALDELDDDFEGGTNNDKGKQSDSEVKSKNSPSIVPMVHGNVPKATEKKHKKNPKNRTEQHVSGEATQQNQAQTVEEAIGSLLEEMNRANIEVLGQEDDFLREMLGLSDSGFEKFDPDIVLDGMMEQLLSKELMYAPMKQVLEKFPDYLDRNKATLSVEEYHQ